MHKMTMHKTLALAAAALVVVSTKAPAQTLRFETNVGDFEMVLNPTDHPDLQAHVDNIIAYAALGRYDYTVINRAAEDFVLQMGGFSAFPGSLDVPTQLFPSVESLSPVIVTDDTGQITIDVDGTDTDGDGDEAGDDDDLTNTFGTVSLALSNNPNTGTSSFFVNLDDNSFLDASGFIPFAEIRDFTTIDAIFDLDQQDISEILGSPGNLAFIDFPFTDDGDFVVINDVEIVETPPDFSLADAILAGLGIEIPDAPSGSVGPPASASSGSSAGVASVPEPTSIALLAAWGLATALLSRKRRLRISRASKRKRLLWLVATVR